MLKNNLKIAFRQIARNKIFASINILGLSLGIAVVILISVFIQHEFSYDKWIEDSDRTYRVYRQWVTGNKTVWAPSLLAQKMKNDFPEVEASSGYSPNGEILLEYAGRKQYVEETASIDSTFFEVIKLPFVAGNPQTAMDVPNSVVISRKLANIVFGDKDPLGEAVKLYGGDDYVITGIINKGSNHSHIKADLFIRFQWYSEYWTGNNRATYVKLHPNASVPLLNEKLTTSISELVKQEFMAMNYEVKPDELALWKLQPFVDIHLNDQEFHFLGDSGGSMRSIYIYLLIGIIVLVVAIINYVNLATARASQRAKEVGVKKVAGAEKGQLTRQFVVEAILQSMIAAGFGMIIAEVLLPFFNTVVGRELSILAGQAIWIIPGVLILATFTGILAGVYPAFIMSSFRPALALKSSFLKAGDRGVFRKVLVTTQFTVTIVLLIVMAFIYRQVQFMMDHDLGFQPEQVMTIPLNTEETHRKIERLSTRFQEVPGVEEISTASRFPGGMVPDWGMTLEGNDEVVNPHIIFSDHNYAHTLDIQIVEGRFMSPDIAGDSMNNFVVNEAFVRDFHIDEPIGKRLKFVSDSTYGQIVGVMKDFHYRGLETRIRPLVMNAYHDRWVLGVKVSTAELTKTIAKLEMLWQEIEPTHPMRYSFLDQDFASQYAEQQRFGQTMLYATLFTLLIALLGLFGLTAFNVERRTREIGIRKVLGASLGGIISLISKDFLRLAVMSIFIAIPLAYYLSGQWLQDFAYRTPLSWWIFALGGILTLIIGFLTVGLHSLKAGLANPVESLRNE